MAVVSMPGCCPHSSCFGFDSAGLLDFGAFLLLGSEEGFLELLAFAILMRAMRDWCDGVVRERG